MTDLWGTGLIEGLPPAVADEPWIRIMDKVYRARHQHEMDAAERIHIYTLIDSQPEEILDVLATQFKVDWYSSWERGSNENVNGMIRRRHPKGTDFSKVTAAEIAATENWINSYPRKILGYKSAGTVFRECLRELGLTA